MCMYVGMILHLFDHVPKIGLNIFFLPGLVEISGLASQKRGVFYQMGFVSLPGQAKCCAHPGYSAANYHGPLIYIQFLLFQGFLVGYTGYSHAYEVLGLLCCQVGIVLVNPRVLVPYIDHIEEVFVQPGIDQCFLEQWLVGLGRAGGHDYPVQVLFPDYLCHFVLGILRAGIQVVVSIIHVWERCYVVPHRRHIHNSGNITAALAYEYSNTRSFAKHIFFRDSLLDLGLCMSGLAQYLSGSGSGGARIHN